jgi:putative tRNA adenosine deaminase-associated protein
MEVGTHLDYQMMQLKILELHLMRYAYNKLMVAIDDSFFIVIRQVGEDMKMMMSDALAALEYEIAAEVLELLDIDSPEEDDADEPAGDLNLLSDLGLDAMDLQMICDDSEKYPDEQLESIARQIGFGDKFLEIVENL